MFCCEFLASCRYFIGRDVDDETKQTYCRGDFGSCARYRLRKALGEGMVPQDLRPEDRERMIELILGNGRG